MLTLSLQAVFLVLFTVAVAQNVKPISPTNMDFSHWDAVTMALITENRTLEGVSLNYFNYTGLNDDAMKHHMAIFEYQVENAVTAGMTFQQYKAFWINVYNWFAVRTIHDNPCAVDTFGDCKPLKSIRQVGVQQPSAFVKVWDIESLNTTHHGMLSLNMVEEGLRTPPKPWIEDVRIHCAIVCASVSCPNIRRGAYSSSNIEEELDEAAEAFFANDKKGAMLDGDTLYVTAIFSFFPGDFKNNSDGKETNSKTPQDFLRQHAPKPIRDYVTAHPDAELSYFSYNWDLNGDLSGLCSANRTCTPWWTFLVLAFIVVIIVVICVYCCKKHKKKGTYDSL